MKVVSFNTNSIRIRQHQLQALVDKYDPDVIGIQETKCTDEDFPIDAMKELGFNCAFHGQKTHYGVALLYKPMDVEIEKGFPTDDDEAQRRIITGRFQLKNETITIINGYFPQGESRDHVTKFPAKKKYYEDLQAYLESRCDPKDKVILMGDFNVAPVDNDLGIGPANVKRWLRDGKTSFLPEEREWFTRLENWGLTDSFRHLYPDTDDQFSWFDYRSKGFEREPKRGLRIDHILVTAPLLSRLKDCASDYEIRSMERPSDHCPVWALFS